jgi:copper homeostasis protein
MIKEACVESVLQAVHAQENGADRIELCAELPAGGITPAYPTIEAALRLLKIPVMVMIRPRPGNFIYHRTEIRAMESAIDFVKSAGAHGIVTGSLTSRSEVDSMVIRDLTARALPLQVTFHKAIDETPEIFKAMDSLLEVRGITRILSSGQADTALHGAAVLNRMISLAKDKIIILAAGRITKDNLDEVSRTIAAREFHGRLIVGPL